MPTNIISDVWDRWLDFWRDSLHLSKNTTQNATARKPPTIKPPKIVAAPQVGVVQTGPKPGKTPIKGPTKPAEKPAEKLEKAELLNPPPKFEGIKKEWLESPEERANRVAFLAEKRTRNDPRSSQQRALLWLNPGDLKIEDAKLWLAGKGPRPLWTKNLQLELDGNRLMFEGRPFLNKAEKHALVKKEYFDPKGFSTIVPIFQKFTDSFANLTRRDVTNALRSLQTYQLNFRRRHPPKVMARMNLTRPGIIMADMFFPSKNDGWRSDLAGVVTVMDAYSRFVRAYAVERKTKKIVGRAISRFLREFASKGHIPLMFLSDKGSELKGAAEAMEPYRQKPGPLVRYSQTGKPVNLVEQTQAQIQRRMQVFRTSGITDDYSAILEPITDSINNQKRPGHGNKTPLELLDLSKEEREALNSRSKFGCATPDDRFKPLQIGNSVRTLQLTFKEQVSSSTKGFSEKWSRDVYLVEKKAALAGNPGQFRYWLWGSSEGYFRHELLKVPKETDVEPGRVDFQFRENVDWEEVEGDPDWVPE